MSSSKFSFLIVGAGRGGTSLISGLLDYHSQLDVGLELFSAACLMGKDFSSEGADLFDRRTDRFISRCNDKAQRSAALWWGNKITTEQIYGLEDANILHPHNDIDVLEGFFCKKLQHIKILFILRDARSCIRSKANRTGQPLQQAAQRWKYSVQCYRFLRTRHANNLCITFEDLLKSPEATLRSVCDFLGVAYESDMLSGTQNSKMLPEYQQTGIDASKAKAEDLPANILEMIAEDLRDCGYT